MSSKAKTAGIPQKKKMAFPSSMVVVFIFIVVAMVLTWLIPSGQFDRIVVDGRTVVDPDSFHYVDNILVNPFQMFMAFSRGMQDAGCVVFMIMLTAAAWRSS